LTLLNPESRKYLMGNLSHDILETHPSCISVANQKSSIDPNTISI